MSFHPGRLLGFEADSHPISLRCTNVIAGVLGRAGEEGQRLRLEAARNGVVTYKTREKFSLPEEEAPKSGNGRGVLEKPVIRPGDPSSPAGLSEYEPFSRVE